MATPSADLLHSNKVQHTNIFMPTTNKSKECYYYSML